MKKLLFALGFLVVAVFAAALAAPWLVDASQYRAEIARRVSATTGHDIAIDGAVAFVLLPSPHVRVSDVRVVAAEADAPVTVSARGVEIDLGWGSLFGQALEITHLRVIEPHVTIATTRSAATSVPLLGPTGSVRVERTDIQNGRIVWSDPSAQAPRTIEQLQATILASPLASSIRITGSAVASAVPVEFDAVIGEAPAGKPNPLSLTLGVRPNLAKSTLRGNYDPATQALRGRLQIEGGDLFAALETVTTVDPIFAGVASQAFSAGGDLSWTPAGFAANDLVLQLGDLRANGAANATSGATLTVDVALAMTVVDLDKLTRLERRAAAAPARPSRPADTATARIESGGQPAVLPAIDLTVDLGVDAVGLNGGTLRQVRLNAVMSRGDLVINQASALLPGETEFTGFAQIALAAQTPRVDGTLTARSDNLRGLLEWLGVDTKSVPAGRLRRFDGQARIEGTPTRLELTGINLAFDATRATGGIAIALGKRIGVGVDIRVDQLNLDGYALAAEAAAKESGPPLLERFDANLTFAAQTVTWGGEPLNNVSLDAMLQGGDVVLRSAVVGSMAGARAEARGKIGAIARRPDAELDLAVRTDDASRLLRLVDLTSLAAVPLELRAHVRGAPNGDLTVGNLDLVYGESRVGGRAAFAGMPRRLSLDLVAGHLKLDALPRFGNGDGGGVGVDAVVKADALSWSGYELAAARIETHTDGTGVTALDATGKLFGGTVDFTARPEAPEHRKLSGTLALRDCDLQGALAAALGTNAISGRADLRAAFSAPMRLGAELWSGLSGSVELVAHDGALAGIDLPAMHAMLDPNDPPADIVTVLGAGLHAGATPFSTLNAAGRVEQGTLTIDSLRMATPVGDATGAGNADLARGTVDLSLTVPVAGGRVPPMQLMVRGPVDEAAIALDFSKLQRYLSRREARTPGQDGESQ